MGYFDGYKKSRALATSPSAIVILDACYAAFHTEIASLSANELMDVDICAPDFTNKDSILSLVNENHRDNPALTGSSLTLIQCLSYLEYVEGWISAQGSRHTLTTILESNILRKTGVLGFSSGIISACVAATSSSIPSFIVNAVEAYRLALWIGIRSQIYRVNLLRSHTLRGPRQQPMGPWGLMLRGLKTDSLLRIIRSFNEVCFDIRIRTQSQPFL